VHAALALMDIKTHQEEKLLQINDEEKKCCVLFNQFQSKIFMRKSNDIHRWNFLAKDIKLCLRCCQAAVKNWNSNLNPPKYVNNMIHNYKYINISLEEVGRIYIYKQ
jgi:hypothetical protein